MLGRALAPPPSSSPGLNVPLAADSKRVPPGSPASLKYTGGKGRRRRGEGEESTQRDHNTTHPTLVVKKMKFQEMKRAC